MLLSFKSRLTEGAIAGIFNIMELAKLGIRFVT